MLGPYPKRAMYKKSFQESRNFADRRVQFQRVQQSNPDKVPVIIERYAGETALPEMDSCQFLVHADTTLSQLIYLVRVRLQLTPSQALMLYVNNAMVSSSTTIRRVQRDFANEDGFVYITYASQSAFG